MIGLATAIALYGMANKAYKYPDTQKVLDATDIRTFLKAAREFKPADEFSKPFDQSPMVNRKVSIDLHIVKRFDDTMSDAGNISGWDYNASTQKLTIDLLVIPDSQFDFVGDGDDVVKAMGQSVAYRLSQEATTMDPEDRSNAFGVRVTVRTRLITSYAVGFNNLTQVQDFGKPLYEADIAPEDARELTKHLILHIEGTTKAITTGRAMACSINGKEATIDNPSEYYETRCAVYLWVDKEQIIDSSTGRVLVEQWDR